MRLSDLNPQWDRSGGAGISQITDRPCESCQGARCDACHMTGRAYEPAPERVGIGVSFDCPCRMHQSQYAAGMSDEDKWYTRVHVPFNNPLDGKPAFDPNRGWTREGDTFENLTLSPSIQRRGDGPFGCTWHGFVIRGEIVHAG